MDEEKNVNKSLMTMDQKAKDLKASGMVLIAVGAVGLLCVILVGFGVIPLNMQGVMKFISLGVMGFLFLVFLLSGFGALKRSKTAAADAVRENEKKDEILKWFCSEYDAQKIDEKIKLAAEAENPEEDEDEAEEEGDEAEEEGDEAEEDGDEVEEETSDEETSDEEASDEETETEDSGDENELYFERTAFMRERISERFLELDEALLSDITDRLYNDIFG